MSSPSFCPRPTRSKLEYANFLVNCHRMPSQTRVDLLQVLPFWGVGLVSCKHVLFALNRVKQARPVENTKRVRHVLPASRSLVITHYCTNAKCSNSWVALKGFDGAAALGDVCFHSATKETVEILCHTTAVAALKICMQPAMAKVAPGSWTWDSSCSRLVLHN